MEKSIYSPDAKRYDGSMPYRRCCKSGIQLPAISLGMWYNFGSIDDFGNRRDVPCLLYQGRYNLFHREDEARGILKQASENGTGYIAFSPLA